MRAAAVGTMVAGVLLIAVALFADRLGIGAAGSGFGGKQVVGVMLGAGLLFGGARGWWDETRPQRITGGGERNG